MIVPLPSPEVIVTRRYRPDDAAATLAVFREAVRRGAASRYSESQRTAWVSLVDTAIWGRMRTSSSAWVAEVCGQVVGFADLAPDGEIGMLYVHPDFTRRGIGKALLDEVEIDAREQELDVLHVDASLVAEPLFAREGFVVVRRQVVERGDERLPNAVMQKRLEPGL